MKKVEPGPLIASAPCPWPARTLGAAVRVEQEADVKEILGWNLGGVHDQDYPKLKDKWRM